MKSRKLMALLLGVSLTIGTLAGCGGSEKETGKTTEQAATKASDKGQEGSGETKTTDGTEEVSQNSGQEAEALDYEGVTLSVVLAQGWDTPGREALFQKYTDKTGVQFDVQMLPDDMASELIKTKFATEELPDIILNSGSVIEHTDRKSTRLNSSH